MLNVHVYVAAHVNIYLLTPAIRLLSSAVRLLFSWSAPTRMFEMSGIETPHMVMSALLSLCHLSDCLTCSVIENVTLVIFRMKQAVGCVL